MRPVTSESTKYNAKCRRTMWILVARNKKNSNIIYIHTSKHRAEALSSGFLFLAKLP